MEQHMRSSYQFLYISTLISLMLGAHKVSPAQAAFEFEQHDTTVQSEVEANRFLGLLLMYQCQVHHALKFLA